MPKGTPFHAFIPPFPIRVDQFGALPDLAPVPALHLLSHTHSDHILGLSAKSFASTVICSHDAKQMLLRHEVYNNRALRDVDLRDEARLSRTFGHLGVPPFLKDGKLDFSASRDLLRVLPLNKPTKIELREDLSITLTLFDANHCPGAVMFLVEGTQGAVLHTGDFRAEPWFLDDMRRNPFLQPYLAPPEIREREGGAMQRADERSGTSLFKTLDSIYLDTECLFRMNEVPTKNDATQGLVSLMSLFPLETTFFINAWTWGYEDIFRAVARSFRSQIHVDRYKHNIYSHLTDPFLRSLITTDASKTRFHACERFDRCPDASRDDVVYINPVTMSKSKWDQYFALTESKLRAAQPVTVLVRTLFLRCEVLFFLSYEWVHAAQLVPLSRHSPLPELRAFVSLFRPLRVVPNSLDPSLHGFDALCIPHLFANCLSSLPSHPSSSFAGALVEGDLMQVSEDHDDVALQNLVGDGADSIARTWADSGRVLDKLAVMEPFLRGTARDVLRRTLGLPPLPTENIIKNGGSISILQRMRDAQRINACRAIDTEHESDLETQSVDDDAHARTARLLFGVAGRDQTMESQGTSQGQVQSSESPPGRRPRVEAEGARVSKVLPPLCASPLLVSECGSRENVGGMGTSRRRTESGLASLQTQLLPSMVTKERRTMRIGDADDKLTSSVLPTPTLPAEDRSRPPSRDRYIPPLADLKNIPLTEMDICRSQPPTTKRLRVEKKRPGDSPGVALVSPRGDSAEGVGSAARVGKSTDAAGSRGERGRDVDGEKHRAQRRALRARSRAIEEKLRQARYR